MVRYNTSKKSKTHTNQVASVCRDEWSKGKTEIWTGERLVIPSVPPSYLNGCDIIEISYVLEVASSRSFICAHIYIYFFLIIEDGFRLDTTIQYKGRIHSVQPLQVIIGMTSYRFQLKVHPSGPAFTLPVKMEVVIGTKPLKTSLNNFVYSGSGLSLNSPSLQTNERKNPRKIRSWSSSSITFYTEKKNPNVDNFCIICLLCIYIYFLIYYNIK